MEIELEPRVVWDALPEPLVLILGEVSIAALNIAAERFFGYRSGEVTGEPLELLLPAGPTVLEGAGTSLVVSHAAVRDLGHVPVSVGAVRLPRPPGMSIALVRDMRELVAWRTALEAAVHRGNDDRAQQLYAAGMVFRNAVDLDRGNPDVVEAIDAVLTAIDEVIVGLGRGTTEAS